MANSINSISTGTGGLQSTADGTSGNLLIQKDAGTIATFSATGVVVSGVVAATTLTGNGSALTGISSGGMDLISTINTTSGTSHTTGTISLTGYKQLFMSFYSIGSSGTAGQLQMTPNGGSANILFPVSSGSSSQAQYTLVTHDLGSGVMTAPTRVGMARNLTVHTAEGPGGIGINTGLTASTTSIVFAYNGGETFDVGQILIYGIK